MAVIEGGIRLWYITMLWKIRLCWGWARLLGRFTCIIAFLFMSFRVVTVSGTRLADGLAIRKHDADPAVSRIRCRVGGGIPKICGLYRVNVLSTSARLLICRTLMLTLVLADCSVIGRLVCMTVSLTDVVVLMVLLKLVVPWQEWTLPLSMIRVWGRGPLISRPITSPLMCVESC